jgi:glycosyltransferase involved in cell wall biosynthesis
MSMPLVTICIPHWHGGDLVKLCLRSIRRFTPADECEVIVVDNGSKDASLDYLRSVRWIRLIERPDETHANWPRNVATAWDLGAREARGKYYMIMHADVFARREGWLRLFVDALEADEKVGAAGGWKLEVVSPVYAALKRATDVKAFRLWLRDKLGKRTAPKGVRDLFPRDYCAIYRLAPIREHGFSFVQTVRTAGEEIYVQLKSAGFRAQMIPTSELMQFIEHVAHGTAAVSSDAPLRHARSQAKVERRTRDVFASALVKELLTDETLDG